MTAIQFPAIETEKIPLSISVPGAYAKFFNVVVPANRGYTAEVRRIEDGSGYFLIFKHDNVACHSVVLRSEYYVGHLRIIVSAPVGWENPGHIYEAGVAYKSGDAVLTSEIQLIVGNLDLSTETTHTYNVNVI